ncbi:hypothetical protein HYH03_011162 [Edaphochlamys debaryana]|uniref:Uncharacterized protein n=1 Tax=Edaphochlamys debaryana TaxID=47281 RepID=A0A836BVE4_9CHLO|nr:hypothetical protein HYH03_011162 [Edaphochlamys debaryana]|eukprot:KAG2490360.1 hypothetical protein HYH03_011162 [Edaphochlamys debaryana]
MRYASTSDCVETVDYYWWGVWFNFFVFILAALVGAANKANQYGAAVQALSAACMSVSMYCSQDSRTQYRFYDGINNDAQTAFEVMFAGNLITSVAYAVVLIGMSSAKSD